MTKTMYISKFTKLQKPNNKNIFNWGTASSFRGLVCDHYGRDHGNRQAITSLKQKLIVYILSQQGTFPNPSLIAPSTGCQAFSYISLWQRILIQTTTGGNTAQHDKGDTGNSLDRVTLE